MASRLLIFAPMPNFSSILAAITPLQQVADLADQAGQVYGPLGAAVVILAAGTLTGLATAVWRLWKRLKKVEAESRQDLVQQSNQLRELQSSTKDALNEAVQILKQMRSESTHRDDQHADEIDRLVSRVRELSDEHSDILQEISN